MGVGDVKTQEARSLTRETGTAPVSAPRRKPIQSYRDIEAYQRSMKLLPALYRLIRTLPREEQWELASQMRRASRSIPTNIAEGYGKKRSTGSFKSGLDIALGSTNELVVHLEIGQAIGYFTDDDIRPLIDGYEIVAKQIFRLTEVWQNFSRDPASQGARP